MASKTPKAPTALQLFRQKKKIDDLKKRIWDEERKLSDMAALARDMYAEKIVVDGCVYTVTPRRGNYQWSWDNDVDVNKIGTVEEFAKLV